jgi:hypothetical protein
LSEQNAIATIALWDTRRFSTAEIAEIAEILLVPEADVERVVHIRREAARGVVAA